MLTRDQLRVGCAEILKNLRLKKNLSKYKMANILMIDNHTWDRYERGDSSPSVPEFMYMFEVLGEPVLRNVLDYIYPEKYKNLNEDDPERMRAAAVHFFQDVASDHIVREFNYLVYGDHGSNIRPQAEMFAMIDHLPLEYRTAVAALVNQLWAVASARGDLVGMNEAVPDVEVFRDGFKKAADAVERGHSGYTTIK